MRPSRPLNAQKSSRKDDARGVVRDPTYDALAADRWRLGNALVREAAVEQMPEPTPHHAMVERWNSEHMPQDRRPQVEQRGRTHTDQHRTNYKRLHFTHRAAVCHFKST